MEIVLTKSRPCSYVFTRLTSRILVLLLSAMLVSGCSMFKKNEDLEELTVEELYASAQASMAKGRWNTAIEKFRTLEARFPYGVYAEQAQIETIYAYYQNDQGGLAIAAAERYRKLHPTHHSVAYAYYLKGLAGFTENKSMMGVIMGQNDLSDRDATAIRNAMEAFDDVYTLFPGSQYATDAKVRSRYLLNALAKNELNIAEYYYSRRAYVAVVNRAKAIVENYSTTPTVEDALALLMFSYYKMGFEDLALASRRVLELNFPESGYLAEGIEDVVFSDDFDKKKSTEKKGWFSSWFGNDDPPS